MKKTFKKNRIRFESADLLYLDANASEPLRPEARDAAMAAMGIEGNPVSIHQGGRAARRVLENAREMLAQKFNARAQDIVFTSGATEANALAIYALGCGRPILFGATEHDAVRANAPDASIIPVTGDGIVEPAVLDALLSRHPGALVCLMAANNETGVLHDIETAAALCARHRALLHVDAAQAASRMPADWLAMGAASFTLSGHKAGGPLGAGALVLAASQTDGLAPLIKGGGQERGWRGGTPALPAIAGLAAALQVPYETNAIAGYRIEIEEFCIAQGGVIMGAGVARLSNTICVAMPGLRAETQLIALDMAGVAVSAGAACSSGKVASSHVLTAMGHAGLAGQAIRISLPWNSPPGCVAVFNQAYAMMLKRALHRGQQLSTETALFS